MIRKLLPLMAMLLCFASCGASSATDSKPQNDTLTTDLQVLPDTALMVTDSIPAGSVKVLVETTAGNFTLLLYGDTPGHRDNFVKLVNEHAYDSVLFHRVINKFMIQGGDPTSKTAAAGAMLGSNSVGSEIPAEIVFPRHFHKRGALAAARTGDAMNPKRMSSGSQFYIVTGDTYQPSQLDQMDRRLQQSVGQQHFNQLAQSHMEEIRQMQAANDTTGLRQLQQQLAEETDRWLAEQHVGMTPQMRKTYAKIGGTPHLDNEYTVYGEVIQGMDVIDRIQKVETDSNDRPKEDVRIITMKVID